LHVHIEQRPTQASASEYHGVVKADGSEEARSVRGTSCREVFEALVLIAVLSLDAASQTVRVEGASARFDHTALRADRPHRKRSATPDGPH
jgi:hypothetical protein